MNDLSIEERVQRLEDIEEIRCLQAKYQRCLDSRDFDGLSECFTEDVVSSYGNNTMAYQGKDAVVKFLANVMKPQMPSSHMIHGGEIEREDGGHAKGIWYLEDHLLHKRFLVKLHGAAIYHVEYRKDSEKWQISSIGYERCYEYVEARGLLNILTLRKTTVIQKVKDGDPEDFGKYGQYYQYHTLKKKK